MRLSEIRPVMKAMKAMKVLSTRARDTVASFAPIGALAEHPLPAFRWTNPVASLKQRTGTNFANAFIQKMNQSRPSGVINVPKAHPAPLLSWLHEAGHAEDPSLASSVVANRPRALRDTLQNEVLASGNAMRHLGPSGAAEVVPTLNANYRAYATSGPIQKALDTSVGPWDRDRVKLLAATISRFPKLSTPGGMASIKSFRRQMSRVSEPFRGEFKNQVFNNQDLLKQKF